MAKRVSGDASPEPKGERAAGLYLRISKDATGESLGVTRQREDCEQLAAAIGWDVAEIYVENDTSAYKKRPEYERMLADVKTGRINAIVAWAPDRIYRRLLDLEGLITVIEAHDVAIRTVKQGDLDLTSAYGRMVARLLGTVASGEGEIKAERWKRSWQQRREAGRRVRTGSRMFGYTADGDVIDAEAAVAKVMAAKIRQGDSILGVARWLDAQGVRATRGSAWTPQSIKRYLTNPRLAGWSTLNGEIVAEGQWEPILDRETWETVAAMLTARTRAYVPRKALLLDLLHCHCGHRMITSSQKGKRTYRCPNRPGMNGCGRCSGNAEPIEATVESYARERLSDPRVRARIVELRSHPASLVEELVQLDERIVELEAQLDEPGTPVEALVRAINRAKERRAGLSVQIASTGAVMLPGPDEPWPDDLRRRRALIDLVVKRATLSPATRASRLGFDTGRVAIDPR